MLQKLDSLEQAANYIDLMLQAEQALVAYQENTPERAKLYSHLGNAHLESMNFEIAKTTFQTALDFCLNNFGENQAATARAYNDFGNYYIALAETKPALEKFQKALDIRLEIFPKAHPDVADSFHNLANIAYLEGRYTAALRQYMNAYRIRKNVLGTPHIDVASSYFNLGNCYFQLGDFAQAMAFFEQALSMRANLLGKVHPAYAKAMLMYGRCLEANGAWEAALENYRQSQNIFASRNARAEEAYALDYIGGLYAKKNLNRDALEQYKAALDLRTELYETEHPAVGESWNNIGNVYFQLGDFAQAMQYYQRALPILETASRREVRAIYENLGICYRYQKDYQSSIQYLSKALEGESPTSKLAAKTFINIGNVYSDVGQFTQARVYYERSAEILQEEHGTDWILAQNNIGICHFEQGAYQQAQGHFREALTFSENYYGEHTIPCVTYLKNLALSEAALENPEQALVQLDEAIQILDKSNLSDWSEVQAPVQLLEVLECKANMLYEGKEFENAAKCYKAALSLLDNLRLFYQNFLSKQKLNEYNNKLFEKAIEVFVTLKQADKIFDVMEQSKSLLLLDAMLKNEATSLGGVPDSLIQKEHDLLIQINTLEQKFYEKENSTLLQAELAALRQAHQKLIQKLERDYPKYHQLRYDFERISLAEVQANLLDEETSMLNYFVGEKAIFVLLIQKTQSKIYRIEKDFPLEKWIFNLHEAVNKYFVSGKVSAEIYNEVYITFAQQLYQRLFPEKLRNELDKKITIIPDGALGYLPFDMLLTKAPKDSTRFKSFAYLVKQHQISYAYSPSLLFANQTRSKEGAKADFLGIAPSFKNPNLQLNPLAHNRREVERLSDLFESKTLFDTAATSQNFYQLASKYRILHLATHGLADQRAGQFSYLAFSNDSTSQSNDLLYVNDLYNTQIQAEMVVLSACETALGEFQKGEGIISLARGFSYAGARSVITTLWSIDDKTTAELMQLFYQNLKSGMEKDAALQKAKLDLIAVGTHELAHPYYWAAFIPLGEMSALESDGMNWWLFMIPLLLITFLLFRFAKQDKA